MGRIATALSGTVTERSSQLAQAEAPELGQHGYAGANSPAGKEAVCGGWKLQATDSRQVERANVTDGAAGYCECGSGKAYSACHGHYLANMDLMSPTRRSLERLGFDQAIVVGQIREYGCGRPMETWLREGVRYVRVGRTTYHSTSWNNFVDFLLAFIRHKFGRGWYDRQQGLPIAVRHPVYQQFAEIHAAHRAQSPDARQLVSVRATGRINALIALAYDLYLCEHNQAIPKELLRRLRNEREYEGALYEAHLAGLFSRAGFRIEFEDEKDKRRTHCEFTAINLGTGRKFSVEAKSVTSLSARAGNTDQPPEVRGKLFEALSKRADHTRIIFIELNRRIERECPVPEWAHRLVQQIRRAEQDMRLSDGSEPEPAYVYITNRPFLVQDQTPTSGYQAAAMGFRVSDFPPERGGHLLRMQQARMKHIEAYQLFCAMHQTNLAPQQFFDHPIAPLFRSLSGDHQDDIQHPFDAFDFLFSTYSKSDAERLRGWMAGHIPTQQLSLMSQLELAEAYCAGVGQSMWRDISDKRNRL